jgi:hypothetical protein
MPKDQQIIFYAGLESPIAARRFPYYKPDTSIPGATDYTGRYDPNPFIDGR